VVHDANAAGEQNDAVMPDPTDPTIVLRLELRVGTEPIEGSLTDDAGRRTPFSGWIGFAAAVERARRRALSSDRPTD
jgi:hypothetical protein